jgi:hypothetical protein
MRDPELMQRADRAAIALEEAWERWRAMHGLGTEPLPPVSSYVGYSLEEPWGQPRVVFGLRADEAELLTTLLDGHDCVGPIYTEVSTRPGWRRPVNGPASQLNRPYASPVGVPAQAPPSPLDQVAPRGLDPDDDDEDDGDDSDRSDELTARDQAADELASMISDSEAMAANGEARSWAVRPGAESDAEPETEGESEAGGPIQAPSLAPLPETASSSRGGAEATGGEKARRVPAKRSPGRATTPAPGPGYRGPRYQGSPPRYDPGAAAKRAEQVPDVDDDDPDNEATAPRRSHVAKLSRGTRRRASGS